MNAIHTVGEAIVIQFGGKDNEPVLVKISRIFEIQEPKT